MSADNRFAKDTNYIFFAQYLKELDQVTSSVSIALRKGKVDSAGSRDEVLEAFSDKTKLKELVLKDHGYRFLKPVHGSPAYWAAAQKDLFAMIRQLGIPTWFCSFSSADLRWNEMIDSIQRQQGHALQACNMTWDQKTEVLRSNPVSVARMFDHRFNVFLKKVILSASHPIGKVIDYFYRIEFQQRGSPHTHCLFWIEDAPKIDHQSDDEVADFVSKYVSCDLPSTDSDEELHEIVSSVQRHSKRHSKSCRKKKTECRFNFPKPPSERTFVARPIDDDDQEDGAAMSERKKSAKEVMKKIRSVLSGESVFDGVDSLFHEMAITQDEFEKVYSELTKTPSIVLRRDVQDAWINQYNTNLLRCWNGNMDIQYVTDAYACVVYIVSYISKSEKEMGILLSQVSFSKVVGLHIIQFKILTNKYINRPIIKSLNIAC